MTKLLIAGPPGVLMSTHSPWRGDLASWSFAASLSGGKLGSRTPGAGVCADGIAWPACGSCAKAGATERAAIAIVVSVRRACMSILRGGPEGPHYNCYDCAARHSSSNRAALPATECSVGVHPTVRARGLRTI